MLAARAVAVTGRSVTPATGTAATAAATSHSSTPEARLEVMLLKPAATSAREMRSSDCSQRSSCCSRLWTEKAAAAAVAVQMWQIQHVWCFGC
jgi:hypothetical protein